MLQTAVGVVLVVLLSAHALPSVVPRAVDHLLHVRTLYLILCIQIFSKVIMAYKGDGTATNPILLESATPPSPIIILSGPRFR